MIMTKEKARELNALTSSRLDRIEALPSEGMYEVTALRDHDALEKAAVHADADFLFMGLVVPAHKIEALCSLIQDDSGSLPETVLLLKAAGTSASGSRIVTHHPSGNRTMSSEKETMNDQTVIQIKEIEIIPGRHEVKVKGKPVVLTFSEFRILQTLAQKPGWVFSRDKIIHAVHGNDYNCTERAVDVQVTGLRKKLGVAGVHIETVRGVGYRFAE